MLIYQIIRAKLSVNQWLARKAQVKILMIEILLVFVTGFPFAQSSEEPIVSRSIAVERQIDRELEGALSRLARPFFEDTERYYYN